MSAAAPKPGKGIYPLRRADARIAGTPNLMVDDEIYCRHDVHGPIAGRVIAVGADGCQIEHPLHGRQAIPWANVLGHKKRAQRDVAILEQGEDGAIGVDANGQRVYIRGEIPLATPEDDLERQERLAPAPLQKAGLHGLGEGELLAKAVNEFSVVWAQHLAAQAAREEEADIRREAFDAGILRAQAELAKSFSATVGDLLKAHAVEMTALREQLAAALRVGSDSETTRKRLGEEPSPGTPGASIS